MHSLLQRKSGMSKLPFLSFFLSFVYTSFVGINVKDSALFFNEKVLYREACEHRIRIPQVQNKNFLGRSEELAIFLESGRELWDFSRIVLGKLVY